MIEFAESVDKQWRQVFCSASVCDNSGDGVEA